MKNRFFYCISALTLMLACTSENEDVSPKGVSAVTVGVERITETSAVLKGKVKMGSSAASDLKIGFQYSTSAWILPSTSTTIEATNADADYNYTSEVTGLEPATTYYFRSFSRQDGVDTYGETMSFTTVEQKVPTGAVDLGIVMTREDGTKYKLYWATTNLDRQYAWGETESKEENYFDWDTYKWCPWSEKKLLKYCPENMADYWHGTGVPDNKTVLECGPDGDDVASKILGGKWRMPTEAEWRELLTKCIWTRTVQYDGNSDREGMTVTSNIEGYKDKSIFLPNLGCRYRDYRIFNEGAYLSSSLDVDAPLNAWALFFDSEGPFIASNERWYGYSIRPVSE